MEADSVSNGLNCILHDSRIKMLQLQVKQNKPKAKKKINLPTELDFAIFFIWLYVYVGHSQLKATHDHFIVNITKHYIIKVYSKWKLHFKLRFAFSV